MFQKRISKFNSVPVLVVCWLVSMTILADRLSAQSDPLPDSLLYPEYRYYDAPVDPALYLIRPGETLPVVFIGTSLKEISLKVGPEGLIIDQHLGRFDMNSKTLAEAREILIEPLKQLYNCEMIHISIGIPYRVAITVHGAVEKPGTYLGFTSQRVAEIIEQAGGVTDFGSTRKIIFKGGPRDLTVDLDLAIFAANYETNYPLYAGISIFVPRSSEKKVHLMGDSPKSIELLDSDNLETIKALAGGVDQNDDDPLMVLGEGWRVATADDLKDQAVFRLDQSPADNRLIMFGGVNSPGRYEFTDGLTLSNLIDRAGGLTPRADRDRIAIFRRLPEDEWGNESLERIPIMTGSTNGNFHGRLAAGDSVFVPVSIGFVRVVGQVRSPGYYPYQAGLNLKDYIRQAGGFTNQADRENLSLKNRVTGVSSQAALDAVPGDGDQVRIEKKLEER